MQQASPAVTSTIFHSDVLNNRSLLKSEEVYLYMLKNIPGLFPQAAIRMKRRRDEWKEYTVTLGRRVKIVTTGQTFHGKAIDVDENGALIMEAEDNTIQKVVYGDCFH